MKFTIISLFLIFSFAACNEVRQEEQAERESFFMKRSESAKSIKDQNFSASPAASPTIEESRIQEEQEELPDNVLEGIIPESQEEKPDVDTNPSVNGSTDTQYLEYQEDQEVRHNDGTERP